MRTLAIINPRSGDRDDLSEVASAVRKHPAMGDPDVRITGDQNDACLLARAGVDRGFDRVFAVGGDGTLNEVINGVLRSLDEGGKGALVGVLPLGTGNDFARTLGLPLDLEDALDALEGLRPRAVDAVRVGGSVDRFMVNASAGGFSGEVDEAVTPERKRSWGPLAYARGALDVLPDPPGYVAELQADDGGVRSLDVLNIVVANGRSVAGGVPVAADARVDDGLLDVMVVLDSDVGSLAGFASRCLVGKHLDHDLVDFTRAKRISIRSKPAMSFNLDGELVGTTPLVYTVMPGALTMLAAPDAPGFGEDLDD